VIDVQITMDSAAVIASTDQTIAEAESLHATLMSENQLYQKDDSQNDDMEDADEPDGDAVDQENHAIAAMTQADRNTKVKWCVFGFVRDFEKELVEAGEQQMEIPLSISNLIFDYTKPIPGLCQLHFALEIDYEHAFEHEYCVERRSMVITACIAEVLHIDEADVVFDGVDEFMKGKDYFGLFCGHIPTSKDQIEQLVSMFDNSLVAFDRHHRRITSELINKIQQRSQVHAPVVVEIHELYETEADIFE